MGECGVCGRPQVGDGTCGDYRPHVTLAEPEDFAADPYYDEDEYDRG